MTHLILRLSRVILVVTFLFACFYLRANSLVVTIFLISVLWIVLPLCVQHEEYITFKHENAVRYILLSIRQLTFVKGLEFLILSSSSANLFSTRIYSTPKGIYYGIFGMHFWGYEDIQCTSSPGGRSIQITFLNQRQFELTFSSPSQRRSFTKELQAHGVKTSTAKY